MENKILFEMRNYFSEPLSEAELWKILSLTQNGVEDIISTRSLVFNKLCIDFSTLDLCELRDLFEAYPELLKRPIIVAENRFLSGYNEEEIKEFIQTT